VVDVNEQSTSDDPTPAIRVVLADDHELMRSGLRGELGHQFEVVGEADDAEGAIDVITARRPDLVVSDLHMPRGGGLAVVEACTTICPIANARGCSWSHAATRRRRSAPNSISRRRPSRTTCATSSANSTCHGAAISSVTPSNMGSTDRFPPDRRPHRAFGTATAPRAVLRRVPVCKR